ncbi:MAG: hypothetical protein QOD03_879 [Verrucomicrobiota bacterium]|jgi:hypothetical protein
MMGLIMNRNRRFIVSALSAAFLLTALTLPAATRSAKLPIAAKWGRFEQSFKSRVNYTNALQQATLKVTFVSPRGEATEVFGFWDGGKTWRVRFTPDQPGRWTFQTHCSDENNKGLQNQSGAFICTTPIGQSRFNQHGPVCISRDGRHFEHADGTPFFWLADITWNGARESNLKDWQEYAEIRSSQKFSAVQWALLDAQTNSLTPFTGKEAIQINLEFFQKLDAKVDALNRVGLLSVIAPFWQSALANDLPEDQMALLIRYLAARFSANDVAWLLPVEGGNARSKHIGQMSFGELTHAPVILFPGEINFALDEFRNEKWVDAFGFGIGQSADEDSLKWIVSGPPAHEWKNLPARPLISVLPPLENSVPTQGGARVNSDDVRKLAWTSLLVSAPAGVTYGAEGVVNWNTTLEAARPHVSTRLPLWRLSLFLSGAKQMGNLVEVFNSIEFSQLTPASKFIAIQPGDRAPRQHIAAAETKDLKVAYVPQYRTVEVFLSALPASPVIQWVNPQTGEKKPAVAVVGSRTCQLPTPDTNDWLLVVKSAAK